MSDICKNILFDVDLSNLRSGTKYNLNLTVANNVIKEEVSEVSELKISEFTKLPSSNNIGIDICCNVIGNYTNITTPTLSKVNREELN